MAKTVTVKLDTSKLDEIIAAANQPTRRYTIADGVEYGVYVELGTTRMAARPALVPAFEDRTKELPKALGQAIERAVSFDSVLGKVAFDIQADYQRGVPVATGNLKNSINVKPE